MDSTDHHTYGLLLLSGLTVSGWETGHISEEKGPVTGKSLMGCNQGDGNDETPISTGLTGAGGSSGSDTCCLVGLMCLVGDP